MYASGDELPSAPEVAGIGLLVSEFRATVDPQVLLGKSIPPGTRVDEVQVGVNHGFWIEGAPHVFLRYANGSFADAAPRLAGNTLLWEQGGLTLRIESALQRDAAGQTSSPASVPALAPSSTSGAAEMLTRTEAKPPAEFALLGLVVLAAGGVGLALLQVKRVTRPEPMTNLSSRLTRRRAT